MPEVDVVLTTISDRVYSDRSEVVNLTLVKVLEEDLKELCSELLESQLW